MILLIYAHPHHSRSIAQRTLLEAVRDLPGVEVNALYDRYPDFSIDVAREQALLRAARLVIWQHPLYWYAPPALLKLWFENVLTRGFAFGVGGEAGGDALAGKDCLWVTSTGATADAYRPEGMHQHAFDAFVPTVKETAQFCKMNWLAPIVVHGAHQIARSELEEYAAVYRTRIGSWSNTHG
jgi:glutathione-regulated potassium-efflux system ancillary protein KefF